MTRPLHVCRRRLGGVLHGSSIILNLLQLLSVPGGFVEIMTGRLDRVRVMTRPSHVCRRRQRRGRLLLHLGGGVLHGGGVLLDLLQVLGVLGGLVEVRVRDFLVGVKQLLALVISSAELTLNLLQVMVRVPMIVQFVMCLKNLKKSSSCVVENNKKKYFRLRPQYGN